MNIFPWFPFIISIVTCVFYIGYWNKERFYTGDLWIQVLSTILYNKLSMKTSCIAFQKIEIYNLLYNPCMHAHNVYACFEVKNYLGIIMTQASL